MRRKYHKHRYYEKMDYYNITKYNSAINRINRILLNTRTDTTDFRALFYATMYTIQNVQQLFRNINIEGSFRMKISFFIGPVLLHRACATQRSIHTQSHRWRLGSFTSLSIESLRSMLLKHLFKFNWIIQQGKKFQGLT